MQSFMHHTAMILARYTWNKVIKFNTIKISTRKIVILLSMFKPTLHDEHLKNAIHFLRFHIIFKEESEIEHDERFIVINALSVFIIMV